LKTRSDCSPISLFGGLAPGRRGTKQVEIGGSRVLRRYFIGPPLSEVHKHEVAQFTLRRNATRRSFMPVIGHKGTGEILFIYFRAVLKSSRQIGAFAGKYSTKEQTKLLPGLGFGKWHFKCIHVLPFPASYGPWTHCLLASRSHLHRRTPQIDQPLC